MAGAVKKPGPKSGGSAIADSVKAAFQNLDADRAKAALAKTSAGGRWLPPDDEYIVELMPGGEIRTDKNGAPLLIQPVKIVGSHDESLHGRDFKQFFSFAIYEDPKDPNNVSMPGITQLKGMMALGFGLTAEALEDVDPQLLAIKLLTEGPGQQWNIRVSTRTDKKGQQRRDVYWNGLAGDVPADGDAS